MSIPFEGMTKFNLTTENPFWIPLRDAQSFHISARDKYEDLLETCKSKGVKFIDIKRHMMNEAKKCGLYIRSQWSDTQKTMVFRTWSDLLQCKYSWVIALNNFLLYIKKYKDYGIRKDKVARKNPVMVNKTTVIRKITDQDGNKKEVKTETIKTVSNPSPEEQQGETEDSPKAQQVETKDSPSEHPRDTGSIVAPISTDLTELQRTTLILQNLNLLGKVCQEKGATKEFNTLMAALGSVEFIIED